MATGTRKPSPKTKGQDAVAMLTADHKRVKALFSEFKKLRESGSAGKKSAIVRQICGELKIHTTIEEEIFYPAVRRAIDEADLMDEALVEHAGAKDLIAQLEDANPTEELYDAKVTVLGEQIDHHVKEEEGEMFPKAKKSGLDSVALGEQMLERRLTLQQELDQEAAPGRGRTARA